MVVHLTKDGLNLICDECGGMCPREEDKYDFVMHLPGCKRYEELMIWERHPKIRDISEFRCEMNKCNTSTMADISRTCPAVMKLIDVLPGSYVPSLTCGNSKECYNKFYEMHEDEVLGMAEEFEKLGII